MPPIFTVLVGVARPKPFQYKGQVYSFRTTRGVGEDLNWYEAFVTEQVEPPQSLNMVRLESPSDTGATVLTSKLREQYRKTPSGGMFVLVLCGHGFRVTDYGGDESDGYDEVFAASDGPILDDDFAEIWQGRSDVDIITFADTCSADSLAIAGGEVLDPVLSFQTDPPRRLAISASMSWESAASVQSRKGHRGVMTLALEDAWSLPAAQESYLAWFREAVTLMAVRRPQQHPRLRYLGPDQKLLMRRPFQ